jgi:hypothetical protein
MRDYLNEVTLFGWFLHADAVLLLALVLLAVDIVLTFLHANQERKGRLWRYFGAIVGVRIPDLPGSFLFFFALTIMLWTLGIIGIAGRLPVGGAVPDGLGIAALGALIGGRLSDRLHSHLRLDRQGYRPNPGLRSTRYYLAEAIVLTVTFLPGLLDHYLSAGVGFALGWAFFYAVIPGLRLLRAFPSMRREPWRAGEPIPAWAGA